MAENTDDGFSEIGESPAPIGLLMVRNTSGLVSLNGMLLAVHVVDGVRSRWAAFPVDRILAAPTGSDFGRGCNGGGGLTYCSTRVLRFGAAAVLVGSIFS